MRMWECVWVCGMYVAGGLSYIRGAGLRLNRQWNTFHYRFIEGKDSEDSIQCRFFSKIGSDVPDTQLFEAAMYAVLLLTTCYVNETLILRSFFKRILILRGSPTGRQPFYKPITVVVCGSSAPARISLSVFRWKPVVKGGQQWRFTKPAVIPNIIVGFYEKPIVIAPCHSF
jgi:hypothetical protein